MTLLQIEREHFERGIRIGEARGEARGAARGEVNAKKKTALNLLDILDDKTIAEKVGLPFTEVTQLRKNATLQQ